MKSRYCFVLSLVLFLATRVVVAQVLPPVRSDVLAERQVSASVSADQGRRGRSVGSPEAFDASRLWMNAGFYSVHFDRSSEANLRDPNPGLGFEYRLAKDWSLTAGRFTNSNDRISHYAGVYYQPFSLLGGRAGVVAGGFDGYPKAFDGGWFPAVIPVIGWEWSRLGLNVALVPSYKDRLHGALSFQLKFRMAD